MAALEESERTGGGTAAKSSADADHKVRELEQQVRTENGDGGGQKREGRE